MFRVSVSDFAQEIENVTRRDRHQPTFDPGPAVVVDLLIDRR